MNKKYKVKYLPLFYDDLDRITDYIRYELGNVLNIVNKYNIIYQSM